MKFLLIAFIAIPLVELYVLLSVGSVVGAATTIGLILLTAFIGVVLVRAQGFATFARVRQQLAYGEMPALEIFEGLFLLVAGALLLIPGFVTDAIGFACLTPPLRRLIIKRIIASGRWRGHAHSVGNGATINHAGADSHSTQHSCRTGRIIDGEHQDLDS